MAQTFFRSFSASRRIVLGTTAVGTGLSYYFVTSPAATVSSSSSASKDSTLASGTASFGTSLHHTRPLSDGLLGSIGNTPLIHLQSLSEATGCRILVKAEHMNPGGSVKDRPAAMIITEYEKEGKLVPKDKRSARDTTVYTIVEGTGGNTGVGMSLIAAARGYKAIFTMPANVSQEKIDTARNFGAEVIVCPIVPFSDPQHYYHRAKDIAETTPGAVWGNQFEGLANMKSHYLTTGPEVWIQSGQKVDGLVLAAGTGGTISGMSRYLKEQNPKLAVYVIDPPGSSLAHYVETGKMESQSGTSITEGIGIGRLTANFAAAAPIDGAFRGTDQEAVEMAYYLLRREGIFVGPSAALNVVGAVKLARKLGPGKTIVTVLCDNGDRYRSKMYHLPWLKEKGLVPTADYTRNHAEFVK